MKRILAVAVFCPSKYLKECIVVAGSNVKFLITSLDTSNEVYVINGLKFISLSMTTARNEVLNFFSYYEKYNNPWN